MKFKSGDKYVEVFVEDFRTRVRLPAPPPVHHSAKSTNTQNHLNKQVVFLCASSMGAHKKWRLSILLSRHFSYSFELLILFLIKGVHIAAGLHLKPASVAIGVQPPPVGRARWKGFGGRPLAV